MADEERKVHIESWPEDKAKVEHEFKMEEPCPVSIYFTKPPANVVIHTSKEKPFHVDMDMNLRARNTIPICIKMCEPICADSYYKVGLKLLNQQIGEITLRGRTRIANCEEEEEPRLLCMDFKLLKENMVFQDPFTYQDLRFIPLGSPLWVSLIGDPAGRHKLAFPPEGMRIEFPYPVNHVRLTLNGYADPHLHFALFGESGLLDEFTELVDNEVRAIDVSRVGITAVAFKGGGNESSLVEVCYAKE